MKKGLLNTLEESSASSVFGAKECILKLRSDFQQSVGRIILVSPFVTIRGVQRWQPEFQNAITRGVAICAVIQEPRGRNTDISYSLTNEDTAKIPQFEAAIELLKSVGIHVNLRSNLHEKLVVIDDLILWEGSLNPLSWFDTTERTRRWQDRAEVGKALSKHQLPACSTCAPLSNLAEQIAVRRHYLSIRLSELAQKVGTSRKTMWELESGKCGAQVERLRRVCDALEVELMVVPKHLVGSIRKTIDSKINR